MDGSNEMKIVLLGKTGSGKSSLGNTILGDSLFKVKTSPNSETDECQGESKTVKGVSTTVIDTPGFFDTKMSEEELRREIIKYMAQCAPGIHAFLIVLEVGRFSVQEKEVIKKVLEYFSEEALKHAVVVFTNGDKLPEGKKITNFVDKNKDLKNLVKKCGGRCHVVDNKYWNNSNCDDYRNNQYQMSQLFNTIQIMKTTQGIYSNELLQDVGKHKGDAGFLDRLFTVLAGVSTGVLLGAVFGAVVTYKSNPRIGGLVGAAIGGGIGLYHGLNASSASEAALKTAKTAYEIGKESLGLARDFLEEKKKE